MFLLLVEAVRGWPRVASPEASEHGVVLRGQPREVVLSEADARSAVSDADAVDAMRKEEPAVGIDEPPLAVHFLRSEKASRLELRAARPAAEAVSLGDGRCTVLGKPGVLVGLRARELHLVVHLSRPVVVHELPEAVHERKKRLRGQDLLVRRADTVGCDAEHAEAPCRAVLAEKDMERRCVMDIEAAA